MEADIDLRQRTTPPVVSSFSNILWAAIFLPFYKYMHRNTVAATTQTLVASNMLLSGYWKVTGTTTWDSFWIMLASWIIFQWFALTMFCSAPWVPKSTSDTEKKTLGVKWRDKFLSEQYLLDCPPFQFHLSINSPFYFQERFIRQLMLIRQLHSKEINVRVVTFNSCFTTNTQLHFRFKLGKNWRK